MGEVVEVFIAAAEGEAPARHTEVQLDAGKGIVGDRYYGTDPEAQVTLVDADAIAGVNARTGWSLQPSETRRNIVTRGIDLNQWETSTFRVGDALLEGVELCEPCAILGKILQDDSRSAADVVKELTHLAGLRCRVLEGAVIQSGDQVRDA